MSRVVNGILYIEPEPAGKCEYCGKIAELRPYGKNNERICYDCGMLDEETTNRKLDEHLFSKMKPTNTTDN